MVAVDELMDVDIRQYDEEGLKRDIWKAHLMASSAPRVDFLAPPANLGGYEALSQIELGHDSVNEVRFSFTSWTTYGSAPVSTRNRSFEPVQESPRIKLQELISRRKQLDSKGVHRLRKCVISWKPPKVTSNKLLQTISLGETPHQ